MLNLINGTLTLRTGRLTVDGMMIESAATVRNDAEVYTYTTLSEGTLAGAGTLWAHITSKPIGGAIDSLQVIIFYPVDKSFVLPIVFGSLFSSENLPAKEGSLT